MSKEGQNQTMVLIKNFQHIYLYFSNLIFLRTIIFEF